MTTKTFPILVPTNSKFGIEFNTHTNKSPYNGTVQTIEMPGARWKADLSWQNLTLASANTFKGFLASMRGQAGRVYLHDHANPNPLGNYTGATPIVKNRENLFTYSANFGNAAWSPTRSSVSTNTHSPPDGTGTTADSLIEDSTASNTHFITQNGVGLDNVEQSFSVYAKPNGRGYIRLLIQDQDATANNIRCYFDITTGAVGVDSAAGNGVVTDAKIEDAGNGFYRCSLTGTANTAGAGGTVSCICYIANTISNHSYSGDGSSGVVLWGGQLQTGSVGVYAFVGDTALPAEDQTGRTLYITGHVASITATLKAGDKFTVNNELKMITADADSDAWGNVTLTFEPPLRAIPTDGAAITYESPTAIFMLDSDSVQWSNQPGEFVSLSFSLTEAYGTALDALTWG